MRVIAGTHKGRILRAPKGLTTRPTADRVREALFSRLASLGAIEGVGVLDAFAGTGTLGIEAISRGAARATFVENEKAALQALRGNLDSLRITDTTQVVAKDMFALAHRGSLPGAPFALLFLDPPYRIDKSEVRGLVASLVQSGVLMMGAIVVWEHSADRSALWPEMVSELGSKCYGDTAVSIGIYEDEEGA
ncbi:MAG: 16S rRNA (guanine(966)-N(2))-methyltransferase RsmD [Coriobacteriia bacterium]|nr:16S rRNA (guanine(966)-N(2))-methyltransferase RsmD [Coriobacteriia bacterium]MDO9108535.1 16S rRNA (guanine(966)-N(2))-methyltransferase RsmD [Coriobacteriia bacterium]